MAKILNEDVARLFQRKIRCYIAFDKLSCSEDHYIASELL